MKIRNKHIIWGSILFIPLAVIVFALYILNHKQNQLVTELLDSLNEDLNGTITIKHTAISPFKNFPYISIDLQDLHIYETKNTKGPAIVDIDDLYIGFDLWTILGGQYDIKTIRISNAQFNIEQDTLNSYNLLKAFQSVAPEPSSETSLHLNLKKVILENIRFKKTRQVDSLSIHLDIQKATTQLKKTSKEILFGIESVFVLNVLEGTDSTFAKEKHFVLNSQVHFDKVSHVLDFEPSSLQLEQAKFVMEGSVDMDNDVDLNLKFKGQKPNFDLLIAFAPNELAETLRSYGNKGDIYFDASVKGKSINGHLPSVEASFGCKEGYFNNLSNQRKLDEMSFDAYFTNGSKRSIETFEFRLNDFKATPEAGLFKAKLLVKNFTSPEIDMQVDADFDLNFLSQFLNLHDLSDLTGNVLLTMNFHDIIDLNQPQKSLEKFNQAYASRLKISNLNFKSNRFGLPIEQLNLLAYSEGNRLTMEKCDVKLGKSDFSAKGILYNLPALIHQSKSTVDIQLQVSAGLIDMEEISKNFVGNVQVISDEIQQFSTELNMKIDPSTLKAKNEFPASVIQLMNTSARVKNYDHAIKKLQAVVITHPHSITIESAQINIDQSDVNLSAKVNNADLWMSNNKNGAVSIDYKLASKHIGFGDLFIYKGKNILPDLFKGHELHQLNVSGSIQLGYTNNTLQSQYFTVSNLFGKLDRYPHQFHDFNVKIRLYENELYVDRFDGMIDATDFHIKAKTMNYALMFEDEKNGNTKFQFDLTANKVQLKDLFSYNGKNYVPEEYRNESISSFLCKGFLGMNFQNNSLINSHLHVDGMKGLFSLHPLGIEQFNADLIWKGDKIDIQKVAGKLGENDFIVSGHWFINKQNTKQLVPNQIQLVSKHLNMESIIQYNEPEPGTVVNHDSGFNLFKIPFPNLDLKLQIDDLQYHKYQIRNLKSNIRVKENHLIYFDQLNLQAAGGAFRMTGYLNGSNPNHLYFSPNMQIRSVKLDEVMYKLDNFGQDMLVSDNLKGTFSGTIRGKIVLHTDLTPKLDESDLELQVLVEDGRLEKFQPMFALSDFFGDKNLSRILFDKLENRLVLKNGLLYLPNMVINSSLGFMELSGKQDLDMQMEYYMRVPLRMVTGAAMQKLFGRKSGEVDPEREDEIVYKDPKRRVSYVNIKISGTPDNYKISLQKNKTIKKRDPNDKVELTVFEDWEEM